MTILWEQFQEEIVLASKAASTDGGKALGILLSRLSTALALTIVATTNGNEKNARECAELTTDRVMSKVGYLIKDLNKFKAEARNKK